MMRAGAIGLAVFVLLSGCERNSTFMPPAPMLLRADVAATQEAQNFAYNHTLFMDMPRGSLNPRFERARDLCLQRTELNCLLVSASIDTSDNAYSRYSNAMLVVSLPHDGIAAFETGLTSALPDEAPEAVKVRSRSTQAQNVTQEAEDIDAKIRQQTAYRDRLAQLQMRAGLNIGDLIQAARELANVQSALDDLLKRQRDVASRVARERLTVNLSERPGAADAFFPVVRAFANAAEAFGDSFATAIDFMIRLIPWLPIIAACFYTLVFAIRRVRRAVAKA